MTSPESPRLTRIVDTHVHFWDPAKTDWYPYLSANGPELNLGDVTGMARRFDVATYRAESVGWPVEQWVNVAAATGWHSIDETLELGRRGEVDALIGGLPPTASTAEAVVVLDRLAPAGRLRGVRPTGGFDGPLPSDEVLRELRDRGLLFEVMSHADELLTAARGLEHHDDVVVVIEHTGWPRNGSDEERTLWADGIDALAGLGDNVVCKLSGLAMPLGALSVSALAPWIEYAINAFGVDRCFFGSNFPVDGLRGSLDELWTTYSVITAGLGVDARDKLFATNAERIYQV